MRLAVSVLFAMSAVAQQKVPPAPKVDASRAAELRSDSQYHTARARESQAASTIINDTNSARTALSKNDAKSALSLVNQALTSSHELDKKGPKGRKVPVYSEIVSVSVYTPRKIVTGSNAGAGNAATSQAGTADRSTPREVQEVAAQYNNTYLDTSGATKHLEDAQAALKRGDVQAADSALAAVQKAVTTEAVGKDEPLLKARENLVLAARQVREGQFAAAQATLGAAVQALVNYADGGGSHGAGARVLGHEITLYAQRLQERAVNAPGQIEDWWDRIASWSEPGVSTNRR